MKQITFVFSLICMFVLAGCGNEIDKLKKYAENNDVDAQMKLAKIYYDGTKKVAQDYKESFKYYSMAAEQDNKDAQLEVVWMLFRGEGTDRDFKKAVSLLNEYADSKNKKAQEVLASMYYFGIFVKKDYKRAFELFLIAAEDGKLYAQEKLGDMYYEGEYVKKNYKKALEWYHKAMEQGSLYGKIASIEIEQMDIKGEL